MIERGTRFAVPFEVAFPHGLVQVGEVVPDNEYQEDRSKPARQKRDEATGKLQWKVTVTDPDEKKAKRASFELVFWPMCSRCRTRRSWRRVWGCGRSRWRG